MGEKQLGLISYELLGLGCVMLFILFILLLIQVRVPEIVMILFKTGIWGSIAASLLRTGALKRIKRGKI